MNEPDPRLRNYRFDGSFWTAVASVPFWNEDLPVCFYTSEERPTPWQLRIARAILDYPNDLRVAVEKCIFHYYRTEVYGTIDFGDPEIEAECGPLLTKSEQIWRLLDGADIWIDDLHEENHPDRIEFKMTFDCSWDDEHGLGVHFHDWKIVGFSGSADNCYEPVGPTSENEFWEWKQAVDLDMGPTVVSVSNEELYKPESATNARTHDRVYDFAKGSQPVSKYGVTCWAYEKGSHSCILLASGGSSRVHEHSAVIVDVSCFVAIGDMLCSLSLPALDLNWATTVDSATCFGVYYSPRHDCLISHGELEIARISRNGEIVWHTSGKDIFSEGFRIDGDHIEAIDFDRDVFRIEIATGLSMYT